MHLLLMEGKEPLETVMRRIYDSYVLLFERRVIFLKYKLNAMYFSATGTTEKIVRKLAFELSRQIESECMNFIDFTLPSARKEPPSFKEGDIVIIGVPVYAGRVPNVLLSYINSVKCYGALSVAVVVYGNRDYDDALIELKDMLESNGSKVVAAGAFIGEHSFSKKLASGRPDDIDMAVISGLAKNIRLKLSSVDKENIYVKGNKPYRPYYRPRDDYGNPVDLRKVTPKTSNICINCKLCAAVCPMGAIDYDDVSKLNNICIKCGACIKKCPVNAKYYDDASYLRHKYELEIEFANRKEPELFL